MQRPYTVLLVALLGAFCAYPMLGDFSWGRMAVSVALTLVMASALFAIWAHHKVFLVGLTLAVGAIIAMLLAFFLDVPAARPFAAVLEFAFLAVLTASIFSDVMRAKQVTMDTVLGACCVYLMLGLTWTGIYELIELASPGSFEFGQLAASTGAAGEFESMSRLSYFSFVTLTTVGYGDVTPISSPARAFAALQGIAGQLYIAIVIARFVAMELSQRLRGGK